MSFKTHTFQKFFEIEEQTSTKPIKFDYSIQQTKGSLRYIHLRNHVHKKYTPPNCLLINLEDFHNPGLPEVPLSRKPFQHKAKHKAKHKVPACSCICICILRPEWTRGEIL